jgi:hypothetical protein
MAESSEKDEDDKKKEKEKTDDKRARLKRSASSSKMGRKGSVSKKELGKSIQPSGSGPTLPTAKEETELSTSPSVSAIGLRSPSLDKNRMGM